jgi:hypothetical protein
MIEPIKMHPLCAECQCYPECRTDCPEHLRCLERLPVYRDRVLGRGAAGWIGQAAALAGLKIVTVPDTVTVRRTWRERLFSWPWRPRIRDKIVPSHWQRTLGDGVVINHADGTVYARAHTVAMLRRVGAIS